MDRGTNPKEILMQRKVFDYLASAVGLVIVVVLLVAGGLLIWGNSFISSNVHNQLVEQQIYFPAKTAMTPAMIPYIGQYAGQEVTNGSQAEAYADHYIAVHLSELPDGGVYSVLAAASLAAPSNAALANEVQLSFRGTTSRGLLLEAYGFAEMGTIALIAAIAAFALAAVMALLTAFGFWHARKVPPELELAPGK
jgi:hypothetical protein